MGYLRWWLYKSLIRDYYKITCWGIEAKLKTDLTEKSKIKENVDFPKKMKHRWRFDYYLFLKDKNDILKIIKLLKRKIKSQSILIRKPKSVKYEKTDIWKLSSVLENDFRPVKLQYKDRNFFLEIYRGPKGSLAIDEGFIRLI